jgi:hypothetical protein
MTIQIQALAMDEDEVCDALTPEIREAIKGKKASIYAIAEEGESRPRILNSGKGPARLQWPRAVIRRVAEVVKAGTKLFERHSKDNSHAGRKPLGEVVGTFTRQVGDKLQAVAVTVLGEDRPDLDVCSIEAEVASDGNVVGDVDSVTGIALSSSNKDSPAFAGAQRLAVLQCFESGSDPKPKPGEGGSKMTFQEVRDFVKEHNVFPNQLFSLDDIKNDRVFAPILAEGEKAKQERDTIKTESDKLKKDSEEAILKNARAEAVSRLEKLIPDGSTDKQKAFYKRRFDPARLEKLDDDGIKAWLDTEAKEYAETAKLLGVPEQAAPKPADGGDNKGEASPVAAALAEITGGKA